jgi:hypothetical protein
MLASTAPSRPWALPWSSGFFSTDPGGSCSSHVRLLPDVRCSSERLPRFAAARRPASSRLRRAAAAPSKEPMPLRRSQHGRPTTARLATTRLPSARPGSLTLSAPSRSPVRPGLVSSRTRPWGSTLQGLLPLQSRSASRHPLPSWRLPNASRARPFAGPRGHERHAGRPPAPCGTGGQAPRAPTRNDRASLATLDPSRRPLAGSIPSEPGPCCRPVPRCRTPGGVWFASKAFLSAKSTVPSAGC